MRVQTFSIAAALFLAVACGMYLWLSQDILPMQPQSLGIQVPVEFNAQDRAVAHADPILNSDIPSYQLSAKRQVVEPVSMRRIDMGALDDEEDGPSKPSMVVLDKVVVAPKHLQQAPRAVAAKATVVPPIAHRSGYTIQLLASHDAAQLEQLIQAHHLRAQMQIRTVEQRGGAWYVLTFGEYNERGHAKHAIEHLPRDLAQFKPWVRQLSDLKAG